MLEAGFEALGGIFGCPCVAGVVPARLAFIALGVVFGLGLGVIPGLGGLVGLAIILPFTFGMDPHSAFGLIIGLASVTQTSDTIPAVLFGVPGTAASMATIVDGYPMSVNGEAGRAFGAGFTASVVGGLFGAAVLGLSLPLLRPVVTAFAAPEFFMLGLLGITMVATISGSAPVKGLIAGGLGLMFGMIGMDPLTGVLRWTGDMLYLWDGLPLVPVALGLFAVPEMVDLVIKGTSIAERDSPVARVMAGVRDVGRHWFLVLRCSLIGTWAGAIPGLGTAVTDWFAYGHARQTEKGAGESFGRGDVRGVIAPESANNATMAGALVPTIAFGVPGSASMALILGALLIHGIIPGPQMLGEHLALTYTIVWSVPIANILGAGLCLVLARSMAKLARVRAHLLFPTVVALVFLAAVQSTRSFGDVVVLLLFSVGGWLMKRFRWPRPPLLLGLVLAPIIEQNLSIAYHRHGLTWVGRPIVVIIFLVTLASLAYALMAGRKRGDVSDAASAPEKSRE